MSTNFYGFTALTGGVAGCLDAIDGAILNNKDQAIGTVLSSSAAYIYALSSTSGSTADGINVIIPTTNPGSKRWLLQNFYPLAHYFSNYLTVDVAMSNTSIYYTGPSAFQPTGTGIWFASGQITINGGSSSNFCVKLWDGATVFSSTSGNYSSGGTYPTIAISGVCINPAGNIRISVRCTNNTNTSIGHDVSGNGKDSMITVFRIG